MMDFAGKDFIEKYCGHADPLYISLYLYICCCEQPIRISGICDRFGITSRTFRTALDFWRNERILTVLYNINGDEDMLKVKPEAIHDDVSDVPDAAGYDSSFMEFASVINSRFPLNKKALDKLADYCKNTVITQDMFIIISKYAVDRKATKIEYLFSIADKWIESGVDTMEKAFDWIDGNYALYYRIMRAFNENRYPINKERGIFQKLLSKYGNEKDFISAIAMKRFENPDMSVYQVCESLL